MKINTTTKQFVEIELTFEDARNSLKSYQSDQLYDLARELKADRAGEQSEVFWNLLQGEYSEWFDSICEKHGIYWISTPTKPSEWVSHIEEFPCVFIHNAVNVLKDCDADTLVVKYCGGIVNSETLLNNI